MLQLALTDRNAWNILLRRIQFALGVLLFLLTPISIGCALPKHQLGHAAEYHTSPRLVSLTGPKIERGKPRPILDGVGWVVGIPSKILLWDRRIDNHDISLETEQILSDYLVANELDTVKVRLNQYAPLDEWKRLRANQSVGWGWRYTFGVVSWLGYTLVPGRVIGGDNYNPYTNTINLYSDVPSVAVHEGGHAKDFARRKWKGTYAALYTLPVVPLYHEAIASNDAIGYFREFEMTEKEKEAYKILYPAYGTYVGGAVGDFVPVSGPLLTVAGAVPGHIIGRIRAKQLEDKLESQEPPSPDFAGDAEFEVAPAQWNEVQTPNYAK